jgi:hypothetical protein
MPAGNRAGVKLPTRWPFSNITRVEFGGRYEEALSLVGGGPPA